MLKILVNLILTRVLVMEVTEVQYFTGPIG
jgi:hypothetical protein